MIMHLGVKNLIVCDSKGAINSKRKNLNHSKNWLAENSNPENISGTLKDVIAGADVFPEFILGIADKSHTRRLLIPLTRNLESNTDILSLSAPILAVPDG